ncbi:MAG: hypothetical protein HY928_01600 [Elusimicrobia bacterium]|nr:hypothetical protein [Elusimicrobiota bacterium]
MRALLLLLLLAPGAPAVEIPDSWRCRKGDESAHWKGMKLIPEAPGPNWGEQLNEKAPSPFIWLAVYKDRDRDVAERRAPITQRWGEFEPDEKCAYLAHYAKAAAEKKEEYDELVSWKQDSGLLKRLQRVKPEEVIAEQERDALKGLRARFDAMRAWLSDFGMRDDDPPTERAWGVLMKLSVLETAHLEFLRESGHFTAMARARVQDAVKEQGPAAELLKDPAVVETVVADIADQLSKDWRNERILGSDFERRVRESIAGIERAKAAAAANAKVEAVQRTIKERKEARKRAEAVVERLEGELKSEKLVFDAGADPALLVGLEEYRRGKRRLYELLEQKGETDAAGLKAAYLELLREVCVTHYQSIRYKESVIKTLCGK